MNWAKIILYFMLAFSLFESMKEEIKTKKRIGFCIWIVVFASFVGTLYWLA